MNCRRGSTASPIKMLKISSVPTASLTCTSSNRRFLRIHGGVPQLVRIHLPQALVALDLKRFSSQNEHVVEQFLAIFQFHALRVSRDGKRRPVPVRTCFMQMCQPLILGAGDFFIANLAFHGTPFPEKHLLNAMFFIDFLLNRVAERQNLLCQSLNLRLVGKIAAVIDTGIQQRVHNTPVAEVPVHAVENAVDFDQPLEKLSQSLYPPPTPCFPQPGR